MDYASSSLYLVDQTEELIQFTSHPDQEHYRDQQDKLLYTSYTSAGTDDSTQKQGSNHRRKASSSTTFLNSDENPNEIKKKKVIHRDIERQRRQEMATLYGSLRSQLPLEHLKGKRSISDHMHEAVNYIKHLKMKIEELEDKKDGLKRSSELNNTLKVVDLDGSPPSISPKDDIFLKVHPCCVGVEVVFSTDSVTRQGLGLSKVLEILVQEGLDVVSCISTKVNERLVHTIESEMNDGRNIKISELQQKLESLNIRSSRSSIDF